jgi:hypothetical protein
MKKQLVALLAMAIIAAFIFVIGCSDDDDKGTGLTHEVDPYDSVVVEDLIDQDAMMTSMKSLEISFELFDTLVSMYGGLAKPLPEPKSLGANELSITSIISYEYLNGWHIFEFEATVSEYYDTVHIAGIDSLQIIAEGVPVAEPNEMTVVEAFRERAHAWWETTLALENGAVHHALDLGIDYLELDTILTISGSVHDTTYGGGEDEYGYCGGRITMDQTVTNLQVSTTMSEYDCPLDGSIVVVATLNIECANYEEPPDVWSVNGTWTFTATVNDNNTVTFSYTDGFASWTVTESCGGGILSPSWTRND